MKLEGNPDVFRKCISSSKISKELGCDFNIILDALATQINQGHKREFYLVKTHTLRVYTDDI